MTKLLIPDISIPFVEKGSWGPTVLWYKWMEGANNKVNYINNGWTFSTGIANKGAYTVYLGQVIAAAYSQAQVQALDTAVVNLSQRMKALEDALAAAGTLST